jgi:hypothetical protein
VYKFQVQTLYRFKNVEKMIKFLISLTLIGLGSFTRTHPEGLGPRFRGCQRRQCEIDGFSTLKAAGEDGIFPSLLQHGIEIIIGHITKKFAACLAYGYIPLACRAVRVIFLPKPGRDSYELTKSFRPISLTYFIMKTMEWLVDSYIRAGPLKSFPLMELQYAYQRGRSTEAAFHDLVQQIEGSLNQKEFALVVFLDIDGAFDYASLDSMDAASGDHGVVLTLRR